VPTEVVSSPKTTKAVRATTRSRCIPLTCLAWPSSTSRLNLVPHWLGPAPSFLLRTLRLLHQALCGEPTHRPRPLAAPQRHTNLRVDPTRLWSRCRRFANRLHVRTSQLLPRFACGPAFHEVYCPSSVFIRGSPVNPGLPHPAPSALELLPFLDGLLLPRTAHPGVGLHSWGSKPTVEFGGPCLLT
jgi:hypothetical protein